MSVQIINGDSREVLKTLPDCSVHCCVTSPPYFGLRDYGVDGQIGLEQTPDAYVAELVAVFREVCRVLRDDGTLWLNIGDSYARQGGRESDQPRHWDGREKTAGSMHSTRLARDIGLKPKDLIGIPWMLAFALRADGWYLRQDIIWHKPNPMPESVRDRCTKAHEYIFLLSKSPKYYYDIEAIAEPSIYAGDDRGSRADSRRGTEANSMSGVTGDTRNKRSVWTVTTKPYQGAHFATFPKDLITPCILAGCPVGGTVLDPFGGSGTTGEVAQSLGRKAILVELNPQYIKLIEQRTAQSGLLI